MITPLRAARDRVTMGVQAVVRDNAGRVLLVRHGYRPGWHFPGGGVEKAESIATAIARELEEETGVALDDAPRLFGIYSHFDAFPGDHIVLFVAQSWRQTRIPEPNREIAELGFYAVDALPDTTTAQTRRRIAEVCFAIPRADSW